MGRQQERADEMAYLVDDVPPWYFCLFLGFQHYLVMFGATFFNVVELHKALGVPADDNETKNALMAAIFVAAGLVTLLQTAVGVR
jgi:nucleobase transporter 1/2